jgi:hypothetical protein
MTTSTDPKVLFLYGESLEDIRFDSSEQMDPEFLWGIWGPERAEEAERIRVEYYQKSLKHQQLEAQADSTACLYCHTALLDFRCPERLLRMCPVCGWWTASSQWSHWESMVSSWERWRRISVSHLRIFDVGNQATSYNIAKQQLALRHSELRDLNPRHAERLVAEVLRERIDCVLELTRPSRDGGFDLLGFDSEHGKFLVEVKRFAKNVGVKVVREFLGVLFREQVCRGVLVSVASSFSADAQREADTVGNESREHIIELDLLDVRAITEFLDRTAITYRGNQAPTNAITARVEHVRALLQGSA